MTALKKEIVPLEKDSTMFSWPIDGDYATDAETSFLGIEKEDRINELESYFNEMMSDVELSESPYGGSRKMSHVPFEPKEKIKISELLQPNWQEKATEVRKRCVESLTLKRYESKRLSGLAYVPKGLSVQASAFSPTKQQTVSYKTGSFHASWKSKAV